VSTKQIVQDLLQKLPEYVFLHEVAREIEVVAAGRQGLAEIERELPSWVIRSGKLASGAGTGAC
jgi:hypothetical protein